MIGQGGREAKRVINLQLTALAVKLLLTYQNTQGPT